jgi:hypothetical protein
MLMRFMFGSIGVLTLAIVVPCHAEYMLTWEGHPAHYQLPTSHMNSLGDFDGDGRVELVSWDCANVIRVRDALTGALEFETTGPTWICGGSPASATTMDLDSDGTPELILFRVETPPHLANFAVLDFVGSSAGVPPQEVPAPVSAMAIRPNPFNPSATIDYSVPHKGSATLHVYDTAGRLVRTLLDGQVEAGKRSVIWDGRDNSDQVLSSGTYLYRLTLDGQVLDKGKAIILK